MSVLDATIVQKVWEYTKDLMFTGLLLGAFVFILPLVLILIFPDSSQEELEVKAWCAGICPKPAERNVLQRWVGKR